MGGSKPGPRVRMRTGYLAMILLAPVSMPLMMQPALAQSPLTELEGEHDPGKRSLRALALAEQAFDQARKSYSAGEIKKGDANLDDMTKLLDACVSALEAARKAGLYKQAEIRVATLLRRLRSLTDDLAVDDRGWAEYTLRQVDGIHDKLLNGVMKK
jgi:hypothetical protein